MPILPLWMPLPPTMQRLLWAMPCGAWMTSRRLTLWLRPARSQTLPMHRSRPLALEERLATVESAQADADALNVDQAYRLTLLELGITE